jgi:hypothetical protein
MKSKKYKKNAKSGKTAEPSANYNNIKLGDIFKTITISDLESQDNDRRLYSANLTPLERLAYLHELNNVAFGHLFINKPVEDFWDGKIYIDKK